MLRAVSGIGLFIAVFVLAACAVPGVKWVNPANANDDGSAMKKVCDLELGLKGKSEQSSGGINEYAMRALTYQEDIKRCMAGKGYQAVAVQ